MKKGAAPKKKAAEATPAAPKPRTAKAGAKA